MNKMKINKIREMSSPDLEKELGELKTELLKRDIAKINTVIKERELKENNK